MPSSARVSEGRLKEARLASFVKLNEELAALDARKDARAIIDEKRRSRVDGEGAANSSRSSVGAEGHERGRSSLGRRLRRLLPSHGRWGAGAQFAAHLVGDGLRRLRFPSLHAAGPVALVRSVGRALERLLAGDLGVFDHFHDVLQFMRERGDRRRQPARRALIEARR